MFLVAYQRQVWSRGGSTDQSIFLSLPEEEWPHDLSNVVQSEVEGESRKVHIVSILTEQESSIDFTKFSSWRILIRVTAYILRVVWNLRANCHKNNASEENNLKPKEELLSPEELESAENHWIKESQKSLKDRLMKEEFKESKSLHRFRWHRPSWWPRRQCLGVLRKQASRVTTQRTLDIAPHNVPRTPVWTHSNSNNGSEDKRKVLDLAKSVKFKCVFCREIQAKVESQVMADLPERRMNVVPRSTMNTNGKTEN